MAKPKFEKLFLNLQRGGELRFDTAHSAPEAARLGAKYARKGWSVKITSRAGKTPFMTCEPSTKRAYWSDPDPKAHAICKLTPAFKKRVKVK